MPDSGILINEILRIQMKAKLYPLRLATMPCLLLLLMSTPLHGQENAAASEHYQETFSVHPTLQHVTVVVSDFARSKKFYTEILKLTEIKTDFLPDKQMFLAAGDNLEIHVGEVPGVEIHPSDFNHFALSVSDFDGFLSYLKEKGIVYKLLIGGDDYTVQKRPDGVRQTFIRDPDGYWVEINDMQ